MTVSTRPSYFLLSLAFVRFLVFFFSPIFNTMYLFDYVQTFCYAH